MSDTQIISTDATQTPEALLAAMDPNALLALVAKMQAEKAAREEAVKAAIENKFDEVLSDINEHISGLSLNLRASARGARLALKFNVATPDVDAHYSIIVLDSPKVEAARTLRPAVHTKWSRRNGILVDGVEYRNGNEAYELLGYDHPGYSFSAPRELRRLGHTVQYI